MTHPPFWQPALARPQAWRTALGLGLVLTAWVGAMVAVYLFAAPALGLSGPALAGATTWPAAALFFASFAGFHLGLALALPLLHRRGYTSLFGPGRRLELRHFARGAALMLAIAGGLYALLGLEHLVLPEGVAPDLGLARRPGPWLAGLLPALALILMQSFAEEAVFRGYLLQQLRARFRSPLVWAVAPSALFGLLHFDAGTYGTLNAGLYVLNATVMGTAAAFVTLRTGNLGAAAGLHFGNNAALVLVGLEGNLSGFSLFTVRMDLAGGYTAYSIATQTLVVGLAFAAWWRWMARHRPIANAAAPA